METIPPETISIIKEVMEVNEQIDYSEILDSLLSHVQNMELLQGYLVSFGAFAVVVVLCYFCYKFFKIFF